jgi:hypothetical protein
MKYFLRRNYFPLSGSQQGVQGCAGVRNRAGLQEEMLLRSPPGLSPGPVTVLPSSSQARFFGF